MNAPNAQPLVSVIIPAYNAAAFISDTLASALSQTYRNLEVLVVDDGSSDDTAGIVRAAAAADRRVHLIQQLNQGVAVARNTAIAHSRGKYIAPLDADDTWLPSKIEKQVKCLEVSDDLVGLNYTWWLGIDERGATIRASHPWKVEGEAADALTALNFIGNASVPMMRKTCLERVGGYEPRFRSEGAQGCEDWDLALRIAEQYRVSVVPEYLTGYRQVPGSMSSNLVTMTKSHELMLERLRLRRPNMPKLLHRWSRGLFFCYIAMIGFRTGEKRNAVSWLAKGLLARDVSYTSPWIVELMICKLPTPVSRPLMRLVQRWTRRWSGPAITSRA
ncbi:MAG TPA: glycosyltransferase family A protein [Burkholderiaceae bacterium]|nr:glycosyltransferase family A protein [Burkholderiaceae bacterium]